MAVVLDIVGSMLIAGFVLMMGMKMNSTMVNSRDSFNADVTVQENMVALVQTIEFDFRKMGYMVDDPTTVIQVADTSHIRFVGDVNDDGIIDTVDWSLGGPVTSSPNPNDRLLVRTVSPSAAMGGSSVIGIPGITEFGLRYLNQEGQPAITKGQIWLVETTIRLESPWKTQNRGVLDQSYDDWGYSAAFWRQTRLASRNLKRHG
jgi:hypothetical protein